MVLSLGRGDERVAAVLVFPPRAALLLLDRPEVAPELLLERNLFPALLRDGVVGGGGFRRSSERVQALQLQLVRRLRRAPQLLRLRVALVQLVDLHRELRFEEHLLDVVQGGARVRRDFFHLPRFGDGARQRREVLVETAPHVDVRSEPHVQIARELLDPGRAREVVRVGHVVPVHRFLHGMSKRRDAARGARRVVVLAEHALDRGRLPRQARHRALARLRGRQRRERGGERFRAAFHAVHARLDRVQDLVLHPDRHPARVHLERREEVRDGVQVPGRGGGGGRDGGRPGRAIARRHREPESGGGGERPARPSAPGGNPRKGEGARARTTTPAAGHRAAGKNAEALECREAFVLHTRSFS